MHLLYLDDAGSARNAREDYFILGGVSVFEAQAHWFTKELDKLAESIDPGNPQDIEFHASEIFSRRSHPWKGMSRDDHKEAGTAQCMCIACLSRRFSSGREA